MARWIWPLLIAASVLAHEHHDNISEQEASAPVDAILWIHMALQISVWGILFPIGMVLGMARSRWHVPLQTTGFVLTLAGYFLGHKHGGRQFPHSVHGTYANILFIPMLAQLVLGVYLKLHIHEKSLRPWMVRLHGIIGKSYPILGWVQFLFGAATLRGYCQGGNLSQCLAHYIMGSAFIAYGSILAILLLVGEVWVKRSGRSPEWWDSWVIMIWGIVNTFTLHHGGAWSVKDMQHTILGILWWTGGALGVLLSRKKQRNVIPSLIIILTGWGMSEHVQALMLSTEVHKAFGRTLILAGVARIIDICFFIDPPISDDGDDAQTLTDQLRSSVETVNPAKAAARAFRHLPPLLLVASGTLFISGTDEELEVVHDSGMDHVTYILVMYSLSFVMYTVIVSLISLYSVTKQKNAMDNIEMTETKWYSRVPNGDHSTAETQHIIGDEDDA